MEDGLERFRAKAHSRSEIGITYSAQVYVNLLIRIGRLREAMNAAGQYLMNEDERSLSSPSFPELARRVGDFDALAAAAKSRADAVQFLAGLIAGKKGFAE